MEISTVGLVVIGAVGGLVGQLHHTVKHIMDFGECTFSGLHEGNTVLGVFLGHIQASDLGPHLFGNGQAGGVIPGPVDFVAGRELLQVGAQGGSIIGVVPIGIYCHNIMLNTHKNFLLKNCRKSSISSGQSLLLRRPSRGRCGTAGNGGSLASTPAVLLTFSAGFEKK